MSFLSSFFQVTIYQPLYNALILLYDIIPDLGVAIIILTVIIRLMLIPVAKKSIESQKKLQEIQPELKKIQQKYKNDRQKQSLETMELYKKYHINPASGCLPMIVQIIFLIALYKVFMAGINSSDNYQLLYSFVSNPGQLKTIAFGFLDLTKGSIILAAIAAGLQFYQTKMTMIKKAESKPEEKKNENSEEPDFATIMQKQMLYVGPVMTLIIGAKFPAGLPIYWITTTLFMIIQQYFVFHQEKKLDLAKEKR